VNLLDGRGLGSLLSKKSMLSDYQCPKPGIFRREYRSIPQPIELIRCVWYLDGYLRKEPFECGSSGDCVLALGAYLQGYFTTSAFPYD